MTGRSTSSSSSTATRRVRPESWRWWCTPTSWARRTASNTSALPSPTSAPITTCCSGPARRFSTGTGHPRDADGLRAGGEQRRNAEAYLDHLVHDNTLHGVRVSEHAGHAQGPVEFGLCPLI